MNHYILQFEKIYDRTGDIPLSQEWSLLMIDDARIENEKIRVEHSYEFSLKHDLAYRLEEVVNAYVRKHDIQFFECSQLEQVYTGEYQKDKDAIQTSFIIN